MLKSLLSGPDRHRVHDQDQKRDMPITWRAEEKGHTAQLGIIRHQGSADHTSLISGGFEPQENEVSLP